jgi:hypothetical protein
MGKGCTLLGILISWLFCSSGWAGEPNTPEDGFDLRYYVENDGGVFKPNHRTDRHYTSGVKLEATHRPVYSWETFLADRLFEDDPDYSNTAFGYALGQNIYTPDHIENPARRQPKDRKYAGWLYGGIFLQHREDRRLDHVGIDLGVTGSESLAEDSQKRIHEWFDGDKPIGWENQLGFEVGANLIWQRKWKTEAKPLMGDIETDWVGSAGLVAGTIDRYVNGSAMLRVGCNLPDDFGPGRVNNEPATANALIGPGRSARSFYGYTQLGGRVIEENRFLTGLSHEVFVGDLQVGLVYRSGRFALGYAQTFLTREFDGQSGKNDYATLQVSWQF